MQQNANYIVSAILQKHRTANDCYELNIIEDGGKLVFSDCNMEPGVEEVLGKDFKYELIDIEILLDNVENEKGETIVFTSCCKTKN